MKKIPWHVAVSYLLGPGVTKKVAKQSQQVGRGARNKIQRKKGGGRENKRTAACDVES